MNKKSFQQSKPSILYSLLNRPSSSSQDNNCVTPHPSIPLHTKTHTQRFSDQYVNHGTHITIDASQVSTGAAMLSEVSDHRFRASENMGKPHPAIHRPQTFASSSPAHRSLFFRRSENGPLRVRCLIPMSNYKLSA